MVGSSRSVKHLIARKDGGRCSGNYSIDQRLVVTELRRQWRGFRARYAQRIEAEITALL